MTKNSKASKPDASPDRLLTDEQIEYGIKGFSNEYHLRAMVKAELGVQDRLSFEAGKKQGYSEGLNASTDGINPYDENDLDLFTAFALGKKAQKEEDRQAQENWKADFTEKMATKYEKRVAEIEVEAKKQGAKELIERIMPQLNVYGAYLKEPTQSDYKQWQSGFIKELGL